MKDHYEDTAGNINEAKLEAYCVKAKNYLDGKLLDGDRCEKHSQCYTRMCNQTSGTCQGLAEGEFCAQTIECAKNYYCSGGVCT